MKVKKMPYKFAEKVRRRKYRTVILTHKLTRLQNYYDFTFDYDSYLGLPAFKVKKGPDTLILLAIHGQVYLNDKLIHHGRSPESGYNVFIATIKREFVKKLEAASGVR